MMFKLHISTSNASFDDDELAAIADILEEVKLKLLRSGETGKIKKSLSFKIELGRDNLC